MCLMTVQISPPVHIEIVIHDAEKAYQFLHDAMRAEKELDILYIDYK